MACEECDARDYQWGQQQAYLARENERLRAELDSWAATADAVSDPLNREILLGSVSDDDFVGVKRPS